MTVGGRVGALWIGGLEPYMDEAFLHSAMAMMNETNVVSIKVMTNKFTGEPAGYGFINFDNDQTAIVAMHRLGGKIIPNSNPPVRFKLNHNSTRLAPGEVDTSIWVGDLTPEVDDFGLYRYFTARYQTIRCAKVVLDESGFSKGYGFVRFGSEAEQQHALSSMTGELGLGSKPIKVSMANQKNRGEPGGGGVSPPSWGAVTAWPGPSTATPWPGQSSAPQAVTGGGWPGLSGLSGLAGLSGPLSLSGPLTGNVSSPSPAAPPSAPSPGPDFNAYAAQIYQQQIAQQQQQQFAAAWSAWQAQQQQQP